MILLRGNLPLVLIPVPLCVWITCQYNTGFYNENHFIPFQTRLSLAWFQIRAPKTKKEYSVVTPVSGNPVGLFRNEAGCLHIVIATLTAQCDQWLALNTGRKSTFIT
jgi:hypothetical protein